MDFIKQQRERLESAYNIATQEGKKSANRHKVLNDGRVRGYTIEVGDHVLVRNVGLRGRNKLANRWEDDVYVVKEQPEIEIHLHRNVLLLVNFLPLPVD